MNSKNNNTKIAITEFFKFECSVLNPHTHFENMLELKIKNYIKKIVDLLPNAIIKMGVGVNVVVKFISLNIGFCS